MATMMKKPKVSVEAKVASKMVKRENGVVWHQKKREPFAKPEKHVFGQKSIWPKKILFSGRPPCFLLNGLKLVKIFSKMKNRLDFARNCWDSLETRKSKRARSQKALKLGQGPEKKSKEHHPGKTSSGLRVGTHPCLPVRICAIDRERIR